MHFFGLGYGQPVAGPAWFSCRSPDCAWLALEFCYIKTELTQALVSDEAFSAWLTGRTPSRRWGEVEDLAGAAVFLASDASRFVNGHILYVDGGLTATL